MVQNYNNYGWLKTVWDNLPNNPPAALVCAMTNIEEQFREEDEHIQVKLDDYLYQISSLIAEVRHHKEHILILEQRLLHREENK